MKAALPLLGTLLLAGCIAGAAMDSEAVRNEARTLPRFADPTLVQRPLPPAARPAARQHPLQDFDHHVPVALEGAPTRLDDCWLRFEHGAEQLQIEVRCAGQDAWRHHLPRAFYMGDLWAARWIHQGQAHWLFAARSRATTGMGLLLLTTGDGRLLWRETYPSARRLGAEPDAAGLLLTDVLGQRQQLRW